MSGLWSFKGNENTQKKVDYVVATLPTVQHQTTSDNTHQSTESDSVDDLDTIFVESWMNNLREKHETLEHSAEVSEFMSQWRDENPLRHHSQGLAVISQRDELTTGPPRVLLQCLTRVTGDNSQLTDSLNQDCLHAARERKLPSSHVQLERRVSVQSKSANALFADAGRQMVHLKAVLQSRPPNRVPSNTANSKVFPKTAVSEAARLPVSMPTSEENQVQKKTRCSSRIVAPYTAPARDVGAASRHHADRAVKYAQLAQKVQQPHLSARQSRSVSVNECRRNTQQQQEAIYHHNRSVMRRALTLLSWNVQHRRATRTLAINLHLLNTLRLWQQWITNKHQRVKIMDLLHDRALEKCRRDVFFKWALWHHLRSSQGQKAILFRQKSLFGMMIRQCQSVAHRRRLMAERFTTHQYEEAGCFYMRSCKHKAIKRWKEHTEKRQRRAYTERMVSRVGNILENLDA